MKLLVLAQTPPPWHGQSMMVQTLVDRLPTAGVPLQHINLRLSRDAADIGSVRLGKLANVFLAALRAVRARFRDGCDTLYYVPAPAKRAALYRDWILLALCRPWFRRTVLHWHAAGLGEWVEHRATFPERAISRLVLGRADLSIVLGESLRADAAVFRPRRLAVVRNGIADPCPAARRDAPIQRDCSHALFIGLCSREKGVLTAAEGLCEANRQCAARGEPPFRLTVAGEFADAATARAFAALAASSAGAIRHVGFVAGQAKTDLFAGADVLVFPTAHPAETQGLVVAEALAFDLPVIITRWRAIAEGLPESGVQTVEAFRPDQIASALLALRRTPPTPGARRAHFLQHFTVARHLESLSAALRLLDS